MNRQGLLKSVAETGYNVGFGAKKNFATYDIVQKAPGLIAFLSLCVGIFALIYEPLASKWVGASVVVLGIAGLYVSYHDHKKADYAKEGERLTALFYRLRDLYRDVEATPEGADLAAQQAKLEAIQGEFLSTGESKQILFSDWYAHYKFFWQQQIEWINEQKQFTFWRDKVPLSLCMLIIATLLALIIVAVRQWLL